MKSFLYNSFIPIYRRWHRSGFINKLWRRIVNPVFEVRTRLHGVKVSIPSTYRYPVNARLFPSFNDPLLELVHQVHQNKGRELYIADVGAAVGDTFLFLDANIHDAIGKLLCIEGNPVFGNLLQKNTKQFDYCAVAIVALSDRPGEISQLVRIHDSSNSAIGQTKQLASVLDIVWNNHMDLPPDIIKTDTDGFDGKVLAGAKQLIEKYKPAIIFEYHPLLIQRTQNSLEQPFDILEACGYDSFSWFDKYGHFSHTTSKAEMDKNLLFAKQCINAGEDEDKHYDIIALPAGSAINTKELHLCVFAHQKRSPY